VSTLSTIVLKASFLLLALAVFPLRALAAKEEPSLLSIETLLLPELQLSQNLEISPPSPPSPPQINIPNADPPIKPPTLPEFELEEFEFWDELCRTLSPRDNAIEAIAACQKAIAEDRRNPELWLARSEALYELKQYEQALVSYDRVLEFEEEHSLALTRRCISLSRLGRYEEAIASCDRALEVDENWGEELPSAANLQRGLILAWQGKFEKALNEYHQILLSDPENALATVERCTIFLQLKYYQTVKQNCGNLEVLISIYDRFLESDRDRAILWAHRGLLFDALGKDTEALFSYENALKFKPDLHFLRVNYCATLNYLGRYEEAIEACEKSFQLPERTAADVAFAWNQYARTLMGLKRYSEALESVEKALQFNPNNQRLRKFKISRENSGILEKVWRRLYIEGLNNQAIALWYLNEAEQQERLLVETIDRQQRLLTEAQKHVSDAENLLDRLLELDLNYIHAWFNRGRILRSLAPIRYEKAVEAYNQALVVPVRPITDMTCEDILKMPTLDISAKISQRDRRTCTDILTNKGVSLFYLQKCQEALSPMEQATRLNPNSLETWNNQAIVLLCLAQSNASYYPQTLRAYQEAARLSPDNLEVLLGQGLALEGMKRYQDALAIYEKILQINPDLNDAKQGRNRVLHYLRTPFSVD
jgi:tetratricopeptide (TPR) repeat protein